MCTSGETSTAKINVLEKNFLHSRGPSRATAFEKISRKERFSIMVLAFVENSDAAFQLNFTFFRILAQCIVAAYLTLLIVIIRFRLPLRLVGVKHGLGKSLFGIKAVHWTFYRWWEYGAINWWTNLIDPTGWIYHISDFQVRIFFKPVNFLGTKKKIDIWHILFSIFETAGMK